jgi:hypothetical protein
LRSADGFTVFLTLGIGGLLPGRAVAQERDDPYGTESATALAPPREGSTTGAVVTRDPAPAAVTAPAPTSPWLATGLPPGPFERPPVEVPPDTSLVPRLAVELLCGAAGYAAGLGLIAALLSVSDDRDAYLISNLALPVLGVAIATGIKLGGDLFGQTVNWWAPFLGQLIGWGVAGVVMLVAIVRAIRSSGDLDAEDGWFRAAIATALVAPVVGGMIGYEINRASRRRNAAIRGVAAPIPGGAVIGIEGAL